MARVILFSNKAESVINLRGQILQAMVEAGHEVYVITPPYKSGSKDELLNIGVSHFSIPLHRSSLNPLHNLRTLFVLFRLLLRLKPQCLLTYTPKPVFYGAIVSKLLGITSYPIFVGLGFTAGYIFSTESRIRLKGKLLWPINFLFYKLSIRWAEKVFVYNQDILHFLKKNKLIKDENKVILINGSGIDLDYYKVVPLPIVTNFLMISRLLSDKGVYEFVAAAEAVKSKYPDIRFKLVGWVDHLNPTAISEEELEKWIQKGTIDYLGKLDDVRPAITDSSVFVLPSYHEGIPRAVLEAMSMGRPIITTDTYGCRETVQDGKNGFLIPIKDSQSLVTAMEYFINQPDVISSMGKASRMLAEERFDVRKVNKTILSTMQLL